ncbi:MAG: hypothetical protein F6K35_29970, partial [Okeania sp. SIO2H7]|nr:hypothetical protein [Okeania sp. SIO2H7]
CTISTFSYANGILSWVIVFPVLLLAKVKSRSSLWKKKWLACIWIIGFISNLVLYFRNYETPKEQPSFFEFLSHPLRAIQYFLCFLGSPLGWNSPTPSPTNSAIAGLALITIFLFLGFYILRKIKDYRLLNRTIGWLAIASYSIISAAIVTLGRLGFGVEQALSSKYTTFSLYLIVSLIHLIPIICDRATSKSDWQNPIILARITTFLATILLVLHAQTFYYGTVRIISNRWALLRGKACLLLINFDQDRCQKIDIYGPGNKIRKVQKIANHLTKKGFFHPGVLQSNKVKEIEEVGTNYKIDGLFESVTKIDDNTYLASGWAVFADTGKPVDAVILTYDNYQGEPVIFGVVDRIKWRADLAETFQNRGYLESGWERSFSPIGFPKTYVNIRAWVFDPNTAKAIPIKGIHLINNFGKSSNATSKEFNHYQWPVASAKK